MIIFNNMSIAVSTSIICASLFLGDVNAIPVPIVNANGRPIIQGGNQLMLQDNAIPLPINGNGSTIYYLHQGNMMPIAPQNTTADDSLYFYIGQHQYVQADFLENDAVRNRHRQNIYNPVNALKQYLENLNLCVKLHIEDWNDNINQYRHDRLFTDRKKLIHKAFQKLKDNSANNGHALIDSIKTNITANVRNQQIDDIVKKYTALKICFEKNRANGDARKAINYLILRPVMENDEEQNFVNSVIDYFDRHLPKHFCHHNIMDTTAADFNAAGIDKPKANNPYTSMSYGANQYDYNQAINIAVNVYPKVITYLHNIYDFEFDTKGIKLTIRLKQGKSTPKIENYKTIKNVAKFSPNELKKIYVHNGTLPDIYNIQNYNDGGNARLLTNKYFYLFFNVGINFNGTLSVKGSLFPIGI